MPQGLCTDPRANAAMERYASGDDDAFGELYDAISPRLFAFLHRRTGDRARAEDLMQQTLLQMHRARGRFHPGADVLPWMYAIARRLLVDDARRSGRDAARVGRIVAPEPMLDGADARIHAEEVSRRLTAALCAMPEAQRVAFELVKEEGLSLREAAEALGTTVTAIKLRTHRAYLALRAAVADDGGGAA